MKIKSFSFKNNSQNWQIEEISFDNLNLLVGGSGVGKTSILKALYLICNVAQGKVSMLEDIEWSIKFSHLNQDYKWDLKTSSIETTFSLEPKQSEISDEKLSKFEDDREIEILHRTSESSKLDGEKLHKLKRTESAIPLLAEEASIKPLAYAFKRIIFTEMIQNIGLSIEGDPLKHILFNPDLDVTHYYHAHQRAFKEAFVGIPTVIVAYYLQENLPAIFDEIRVAYTDIFSNVKDVRVSTSKELNDQYNLFFEIEEYGLEDRWIPQHRISSGMYLVLAYLIKIFSVPEDSVFIVDEFENGLGINCMPQLTDIILDKSPELQFILTSHHPYIINNIPWKTWQLVSRTNGTIKTRKAIDIPQLDTASRLDKFTQLLNLLEYEDAIA
jgi:AAA15 family ATPase/GTPase